MADLKIDSETPEEKLYGVTQDNACFSNKRPQWDRAQSELNRRETRKQTNAVLKSNDILNNSLRAFVVFNAISIVFSVIQSIIVLMHR